MKNFQEMLDGAFSAPKVDRTPQAPTAASQERERAFAEQATKIEKLRGVRLSTPEVRQAPLVFEVVRHRGYWRTLHRGKHSAPFPDQGAAVLGAKKLARKKHALGYPVEVVLRRTDGETVAQSLDDDECVSSHRVRYPHGGRRS